MRGVGRNEALRVSHAGSLEIGLTDLNPEAPHSITTPHPSWRCAPIHLLPQGEKEGRPYAVPNFNSLIASKSCTPPPTRLVV
jgi:hypothetical protein